MAAPPAGSSRGECRLCNASDRASPLSFWGVAVSKKDNNKPSHHARPGHINAAARASMRLAKNAKYRHPIGESQRWDARGLSFERSPIGRHHCIPSHAPPCTPESPPFGRCRPRIASRFASMPTSLPVGRAPPGLGGSRDFAADPAPCRDAASPVYPTHRPGFASVIAHW